MGPSDLKNIGLVVHDIIIQIKKLKKKFLKMWIDFRILGLAFYKLLAETFEKTWKENIDVSLI
jgi:hypothetical protein